MIECPLGMITFHTHHCKLVCGATSGHEMSGESGMLLRSGGLKVRLAQVDCVGKFKGKGSDRVFGNDQRRLRDLKGQKGDEAIQERWIENQVKLRARLLLEVGLYIHEGR